MQRQTRNLNLNYILLIVLFSLSIHQYLFADLGSVSPTINQHICPEEWVEAGLEGGDLSDDYPVIAGTIYVDDSDDIQDKINDVPINSGIWKIMLQPGTYVLDNPITMKSNVILAGPYLTKENKDEDDRAIIEFNLSNSELNCIVFDETISNAGIEDVYIKRIDTSGDPGGTQTGNNIYLFNCNNCFVSGVESYYPQNHHVTMYNCDHIEVRGCYFHEAQDYGELGDGYGAVCDYSNYCLIENNIFDHLRHSMLLQNDSKYNVFGYNYSIGAEQSNLTYSFLGIDLIESDFSGDMVCHGHPDDNIPGPFRNLFEGNIGQFMWVDLFHWCNGPDNTFHRNAALKHGYHVYPIQKIQIFSNNYLKENNRWLHLFGSPRLRLFTSTYFESHSDIWYRNIWGTSREETIGRNDDLKNYDGEYFDTFEHDESYYIEGQPELLCTGWPFNPKEDDNAAKLRYNVGGWKHTKSRHDNSVVARYFVLDQDIVVADPPTLPDFMDQDDWRTYDGDLVIPDTVCLIVNPGVTLEFEADRCMYLHGSLIAKGMDHEDGEIIFKSVGTDRWEGINIGRYSGQSIPVGVSGFEYCKFSNSKNTLSVADYHGGAISVNMVSYRDEPDIIIKNCIFNNNKGLRGGAIFINSQNDGSSGVENIYGIIEDCEFHDNVADDYGGAIYLCRAKAIIKNNKIYNNYGDVYGNAGDLRGGGIYVYHSCPSEECDNTIDIIGNLICNNAALYGGGLYLQWNKCTNLINNTIADNFSSTDIYIKNVNFASGHFSNINYINNINYGSNTFLHIDNTMIDQYAINRYNNNSVSIMGYNEDTEEYFSTIPGESSGNIWHNPLYINPNNMVYSLQSTSPCINAGLSKDEFISLDGFSIDDWNALPSKDLDGNPRITQEIIDIGAYEYYNPSIYLPQQEIDFGNVRHDRVSSIDLRIENNSLETDLTDIEITFADTIAEYYSVNPEDIPDVIPHASSQGGGNHANIPIYFCCHKMFVNCDGIATITSSDQFFPEIQIMLYGKPALDNEWNWISFPELNSDNGVQDAEEVLEPLVPNANQLVTKTGEMIYDFDTYQWDHSGLNNIESTVGYKLEMLDNCYLYPFSVIGDNLNIIPSDTQIHLDVGYNWIGYWLPQSQNFDVAFGDNFESVHSIQAENWYYSLPESIPDKGDPNQSSPCPSTRIRPLHYGRGYIVNVTEEFDLTWTDPGDNNTKEEGYEETESFSYDEKQTYEVIDVIGLDESAEEIGVFDSDDTCLGASLVDSLGTAQILTYVETGTKEGTELIFKIYQGQGKGITKTNDYLLYDFESQEFIEAALKSGIRKYNIILFDSGNAQLVDKLILQQNIPNPFNHKMSSTSISFALPLNDLISLKIYNIRGQLVKTVIDNEEMNAGYHTIQWDGKNEVKAKVCNGVYLYKIEDSGSSIIKKMIVLD